MIFLAILSGGCAEEEPEAAPEPVKVEGELAAYLDEKYGAAFDWTLVNGEVHHGNQPMNAIDDVHEMYRHMGVNLEPYAGEYLTYYHFDIEESCTEPDGDEQRFSFTVVLTEDEEKIIGDHMVLNGYEPGGIATVSSDVLFEQIGCE
ncbi:hypothetical protein [Indiicoccus explosivorum]|uniref:hypothetical protein n=1 Tax=Indiicoccus explosivorum TaxID=1917864 RepID=UPI000B450E10|nr:hypothetical protein [Indiicoccus explosivorum]